MRNRKFKEIRLKDIFRLFHLPYSSISIAASLCSSHTKSSLTSRIFYSSKKCLLNGKMKMLLKRKK